MLVRRRAVLQSAMVVALLVVIAVVLFQQAYQRNPLLDASSRNIKKQSATDRSSAEFSTDDQSAPGYGNVFRGRVVFPFQLDDPFVTSAQKATTPQVHQRLTALLPPRLSTAPPRPIGMLTSGPIRAFKLLAEGYIREYWLRGKDPETGMDRRVRAGFVQVVAHTHRSLAEDEVEWFGIYGWPASVFSVEIDGRIYHRVLIGPFASPDDAQAVRAQAPNDARALEYIQRIMGPALVEPDDLPGQSWRLRLKVDGEPSLSAKLLETYGWPVLGVTGQAVLLGPFAERERTKELRRTALQGSGWGPLIGNRE